MVAYSFKGRFAEPIVSGEKSQTIRALRKRHAHVGEAVQLYTAMRTKQCRKLLDVDPVCTGVHDVKILISRDHPEIIAGIRIDDVPLLAGSVEEFAWKDGFRPGADGSSATLDMGRFWLKEHGEGSFHGVLIKWDGDYGR